MASKTNTEAMITVVHPLCDNIRLSLAHRGPLSDLKVRCILSLNCYITKQYSKLIHFKGGIYPIYVLGHNNELSERHLLSEGKRLIVYVLDILKEADRILYIEAQSHVPEKVHLLEEAHTRLVDFLVNHMSTYVFDIPFSTYESIPFHIRKKMVDKYIQDRFSDVISGDVIVKKFEKTMSFSNFTDINILLQYTTFLHNRLRNKEKAKTDFLEKQFRYDVSYNHFVRQSKQHYYALYPERKIVVGGRKPVNATVTTVTQPVSNGVPRTYSSSVPSNVTMRYSQVSTSGLEPKTVSKVPQPIPSTAPVRIHLTDVSRTLASIRSSSFKKNVEPENKEEPPIDDSPTEADVSSDSDDAKLVIEDSGEEFVPETDDEADSEGSEPKMSRSRKRTRCNTFTSIADTAKRRRK